uniref:Catenin delta-2 n=1 Tax=Lygus hesperus TaxID=30085 RepID=A0A0A9YGW9_LYGHE
MQPVCTSPLSISATSIAADYNSDVDSCTMTVENATITTPSSRKSVVSCYQQRSICSGRKGTVAVGSATHISSRHGHQHHQQQLQQQQQPTQQAHSVRVVKTVMLCSVDRSSGRPIPVRQ